ncbi:MAG: SDR family oxidoreductase [Anaerolineae bacterium]|nr:SDR family oxidoreductase [Anaerolineae bacterium]
MNQTIFVTGADKGLGLSLVAKFLREGFRVFAGQFADGANLQHLADQFPEGLVIVPLDVTDTDSVRLAASAVSGQAAALDILINNAGVLLEDTETPLEQLDLTDHHLQQTMEVNTFGPLRMTQQFLPLLQKGQRKLIVNISSEAGSIADCQRQREYAYCMSKAALNMQSKILQNHLGPSGIKVLAIHPGWMQTDMGGSDADIHPDVAAEGIFGLATRDWSPDDEIYLDYRGNPTRW